jgi:hypothetical protein
MILALYVPASLALIGIIDNGMSRMNIEAPGPKSSRRLGKCRATRNVERLIDFGLWASLIMIVLWFVRATKINSGPTHSLLFPSDGLTQITTASLTRKVCSIISFPNEHLNENVDAIVERAVFIFCKDPDERAFVVCYASI